MKVVDYSPPPNSFVFFFLSLFFISLSIDNNYIYFSVYHLIKVAR